MAKRVDTFQISNWLRVQGHIAPLEEMLARCADQRLPVELLQPAAGDDGAAIDLTLHTQHAATPPAPPPPGASYAGFSPTQRRAFLTWSTNPTGDAPPAFQQLYVANLEPTLLESPIKRAAVLEHMHALCLAPAWHGNTWLHRAYLLGGWLAADGVLLAAVLGQDGCPVELLGVGLGLQALLQSPMTLEELGRAQMGWLRAELMTNELVKMRLASLTNNLGADPLAHALTQVEAAAQSHPWRTAHRGLRLAIPQPDLRPILEPLLRDMRQVDDVAADQAPNDGTPDDGATDNPGWQLILEFGHSRSENFDYLLGLCRRLPGFSQIMDQDRRLVYRVVFRRSEMRRFWRIWDVVQGWSSTRVYRNGDELEKWKIWPYSQYLS
jgi:hypothetical protein